MGAVLMSELPPGFVLESNAPPLPEGFQVEGVAPQQKKQFGWQDTWPVRVAKGLYGSAKSAVTLPGDVYAGTAEVPSSANDGQNMGRVLDMATLGSPVNPAIRAGDQVIPGIAKNLRTTAEVPSTTALKEAGGAGFDRAREMGVDYSGEAVKNLGQSLRASIEKDGIIAEISPTTFSILKKLESPPEGAVASLANLHAARRSLNEAAKDPKEAVAANRLIQGLDDFITKADPASVVAGPAAEAGRVFKDALGNYAAAKRSNTLNGELDNAVTGAIERADLSAGSANSGQNIDNAIRQRFRSLASQPNQVRGFTPEEIASVEGVARGTTGANLARGAGNMMGGGGGLGSIVAAAAGGYVNPLLAGLPVAGYGLKQIANNATRKAANQTDELIRMRSPLYEEALRGSPMEGLDPIRQAMMVRALMSSDQQ